MGRHGQGSGGQARVTICLASLAQALEMYTEKPPEATSQKAARSRSGRRPPQANCSHGDLFILLPHLPCAHLVGERCHIGVFCY